MPTARSSIAGTTNILALHCIGNTTHILPRAIRRRHLAVFVMVLSVGMVRKVAQRVAALARTTAAYLCGWLISSIITASHNMLASTLVLDYLLDIGETQKQKQSCRWRASRRLRLRSRYLWYLFFGKLFRYYTTLTVGRLIIEHRATFTFQVPHEARDGKFRHKRLSDIYNSTLYDLNYLYR